MNLKDELLKEINKRDEKNCIISGISKKAEAEIMYVADDENIDFETATELLISMGSEAYYNNKMKELK